MTKPHEHIRSDAERITALEANLSSLTENTREHGEQISRLAESVNKVVSTVQDGFGEVHSRVTEEAKAIRADMAKSRAAPWGTIVGAIGVLATIGSIIQAAVFAGVAALVYSITTPTNIAVDNLRQDVAAVSREADRARDDIKVLTNATVRAESDLRNKLSEVETQFEWMTDAVNQDRAHRVRMEGLMWRGIFGDDLPLLHVNPIGPKRKQPAE